ncbi:MAG: hypothetical protein RI560_13225 [Natronomonas sp.]|uniref:DUF7982 domain-containing protein n=1 Tax=Natronomonas salsuginis TaxID=2217661 RepID=A0A4U5JD00_9EURY|nr:hypothetical protein [Natronomonas salsuginis]MDR9382615.1 hypothetical protein [Natronomonas sp.]TKR25477.1 hypothetical protein DM868_08615 [Natronomonas salsuginis]
MSDSTTELSKMDTESSTEISSEPSDETALTAELDVIREENERLRDEYVRARKSQYRATALTLGIIGGVTVLASAFFPDVRTVLLALGGTGVFLGILTYYLTPERFISASVGRDVYTALARNEAALVSELGLHDDRVYVPRTGAETARLFVPHHSAYDLPDDAELDDLLVVTDRNSERGVSLRPTGSALVSDFEFAGDGDTETTNSPSMLAAQLTDALVEQFELVETAAVETATESGRLTVALTDSSYGPIDTFDHPVGSFLAVGLAVGLDEPVSLSVETPEADDRVDYLVTCRWPPSE